VAPDAAVSPPEPVAPDAAGAPPEPVAPDAAVSVVIALTRFHRPTQWSQALSRFLLETGPDTWPDSEDPDEATMALSHKARSVIRGTTANTQRPSPFPGRQATAPFVEDGEFLDRDAPDEETMAAALASLAEATERAWSTCDSVVKNIQPTLTCSDLRFGRDYVFEEDEEGEASDEAEKSEGADETAAASPLSDAAPAAEIAPLVSEGAPVAEGPPATPPIPNQPLEAASPEGSNPAPPSPSGLVSEGAPVAEGPPTTPRDPVS
jgi:hypothetical protein